MARMIRRRRNVILIVLLLGLGWLFVKPLTLKDDSTDEIKQNVGLHHSVNKFDIPKELDPIPTLKSVAKTIQVFKTDVNDTSYDDLSEIDYPQPELSQNTFHKASNSKRYPVATRSSFFARFRRGRKITPILNKTSLFRLFIRRSNFPGHLGRMVRIDPKSLSSQDLRIYNSGWEKYFHNEYVNNMISQQRELPDVRDPNCRSIRYSVDGVEASVIIVVHNEAWMTLLRTIHSVIDQSPPELLKEIILVDDASTFVHLRGQLTKYVSHLSKVRLVRLDFHRGASFARHIGASLATGNVIVFLDSHCECTTGWLEPLLSHVAQNASNVAIPVIDLIDDDTFAYRAYDASSIRIGSFNWTLAYQWIEIPDYEKQRRNSDIDPIRNPVMWGGIFAISRDFFNHLNGYETSLRMSGAGHNIEMSLKIWMCGGTLETIPCSHVGHLFRNRKAISQSSNSEAVMNHVAVAYMWLDEYKDMHFQRMGFRSPPQVNISASHVAFRERLQCHSFDWFLRNVFRNLYKPFVSIASGKIRSKMKSSSSSLENKVALCLTVSDLGLEKRLNISECRPFYDKNQLWSLSRTGEIRQENNCLDFPGGLVLMYSCHGGKGNQQWTYREDGTIQQVGTKRCLTLSLDRMSLTMEECASSNSQIWFWKRNSEGERASNENRFTIKQELAKDLE